MRNTSDSFRPLQDDAISPQSNLMYSQPSAGSLGNTGSGSASLKGKLLSL